MDRGRSGFSWFGKAPTCPPTCPPVCPPVFAGLAEVRAYWEGLRQAGGLPERAALDPRGLGGALDRVFLAERIGHGLVQVRIAGSALGALAGIDLRGLPLSCLFAAEARPLLAEVLEEVTRGQGLAELDLGRDRGGPGVQARLLLLPLADGPERRLVLGCLGIAPERPGKAARFTILRRQVERLAPAPPPAPPPAHAPPAAPVPAPLRRLRHLTLVQATQMHATQVQGRE